MTTVIRGIIITLTLIGIIITAIWYYQDKTWEPLAALFLLTAGLLSELFIKTKAKKEKSTFSQKAGDNSSQIQSGRDTNINKV